MNGLRAIGTYGAGGGGGVVVVVVVVVLGDQGQEEVGVAGLHYAEERAMGHEHCLYRRLLLDCHPK